MDATPQSQQYRESEQRRPRWVYAVGEDPDYRFSFANERTFLAWLRTALALLAGGVALHHVDLSLPPTVQRTLATALVALGILCAATSWWRWARAERAMRSRKPLPGLGLGGLLAVVLAGIGLVFLAVV